MGWDGIGWDGRGWDGMGSDGMGSDGMGWHKAHKLAMSCDGRRWDLVR